MKYVHGKCQPAISKRYIVNMLIVDAFVILAVLIGSKLYGNYLVRRDAQTIRTWCESIVCVYIDPKTGIGYPAVPEVVPEQAVPVNIDTKYEEA